MVFHYTGRRAIHQKFVKNSIFPEQSKIWVGLMNQKNKWVHITLFSMADFGAWRNGVRGNRDRCADNFPRSYIGSDHSRIKKIYAEARVHFEETQILNTIQHAITMPLH